MDEDEFWELIEQYHEKFGEGPPVFDMEEDVACQKMREAIETGTKLVGPADRV